MTILIIVGIIVLLGIIFASMYNFPGETQKQS